MAGDDWRQFVSVEIKRMSSFQWSSGIAIATALSVMPDVAAAAEPEVPVPLDPDQGQLPRSSTASRPTAR